MAKNHPELPADTNYAMELANDSYEWYKGHAIRSRKAYKISETAILVTSSAIPLSAVFTQTSAILPACLGVVVVILSGLRSIFHWQENYVRFSGAREAVEAERRRYHTGAAPYDDPGTKEEILAAAVTRIEQGEMNSWLKVALERPKPGPTPSSTT